MAPLADFILAYIPVSIPTHLTSYVPGVTPLSTTPAVLGTLIAYLVVIFGIKGLMTERLPYKLALLFQAHNAILSSGSLLLLVLLLEEIGPIVWQGGILHGLCAREAWTPRMEFYYMVNYYFKYMELLDTVFLALKKKPMQFLHIFHHSATALLCYAHLNGRVNGTWSVVGLNLTVHVVMYYYFYATACGSKIWWKKYLTIMQIMQFIIDLGVVYFGAYSYMAATYLPNTLPHVANCAYGGGAGVFGCVLLTSYLGLFVNFYLQTYQKPAAAGIPAVNGIGNGTCNGRKKFARLPPEFKHINKGRNRNQLRLR